MAEKTGIPSIDRDLAALDRLQKRSDKSTGLVGKLLQLPAADGHAYYTVEAEKGKKVLLRHHALIDGWTDTMIGRGGWFPTNQIAPIIRREESFRKALEATANKQKVERKSYAQKVTEAAMEDLGADAGVYELASWAWKKSRGSADGRLKKEGRVPWTSDLTRALVDGKAFASIQALPNTVSFGLLADKSEDPIVYANPSPPKDKVLLSVSAGIQRALGIDPDGLDVVKPSGANLDNVFLNVVNKDGAKVASVCYNPADGKILQINVAFMIDTEGNVKGQG